MHSNGICLSSPYSCGNKCSLRKSPEKLPLCQLKLLMTQPAQETVPGRKAIMNFILAFAYGFTVHQIYQGFISRKRPPAVSRPTGHQTSLQIKYYLKKPKLNAIHVFYSIQSHSGINGKTSGKSG